MLKVTLCSFHSDFKDKNHLTMFPNHFEVPLQQVAPQQGYVYQQQQPQGYVIYQNPQVQPGYVMENSRPPGYNYGQSVTGIPTTPMNQR